MQSESDCLADVLASCELDDRAVQEAIEAFDLDLLPTLDQFDHGEVAAGEGVEPGSPLTSDTPPCTAGGSVGSPNSSSERPGYYQLRLAAKRARSWEDAWRHPKRLPRIHDESALPSSVEVAARVKTPKGAPVLRVKRHRGPDGHFVK